MNGKTKIVAAVAAGAVALTIGAGAARCAMDAPDAQNGQQAPQEQAQGKQDDAKASQSSQQAPDERLLSESEFSSLANTSWTSRDGASKLSIATDALIERTADSTSVVYYTVSDLMSAISLFPAAAAGKQFPNSAFKDLIPVIRGSLHGCPAYFCHPIACNHIRYT